MKLNLARRFKVVILAGLGLFLVPVVPILIYRFVNPPVTPLMLIRQRQGYQITHQWVRLRDIAVPVRRAAVYSEDNWFCSEASGIDFDSLNHEISKWSDGENATGASTITMQLARNLFLWPGHSFIRKLLEIWITPQIALLMPKRRVLELYLNVVEFGPGIFGVQAAAQHYFRKNPSQLNVIEATRLLQVLPDPLHRDPNKLAQHEIDRADNSVMEVYFGDSKFDCTNPP